MPPDLRTAANANAGDSSSNVPFAKPELHRSLFSVRSQSPKFCSQSPQPHRFPVTDTLTSDSLLPGAAHRRTFDSGNEGPLKGKALSKTRRIAAKTSDSEIFSNPGTQPAIYADRAESVSLELGSPTQDS